MNILYVTAGDPRATSSGNLLRSHFLWNALQQVGNVFTVHIYGGKQECQDDEMERIHHVCIDHKCLLALAIDRFLIRLTGVVRWPWRSRAYIRKLIGWSDTDFDVVVVRYLSNAASINAWKLAPRCFVDIDDDPVQYFKTSYSKRLPRILHGMTSSFVAAWAKYVSAKLSGAWFVNQRPAFLPISLPCSELPNLAKLPNSNYCAHGCQARQLMSVGLMSYAPNYEGVDWFVSEIWPAVRNEFNDLQYVIAGRGAPDLLVEKWSKVEGVKCLGFVDDIDKLYERSLAVVAPVLSGSGTCIKVLEAQLRGRHVFGTRFAFRGVNTDAVGIHVCITAEEFVSSIASVDRTGMWSLPLANENGFDGFVNNVKGMIQQ